MAGVTEDEQPSAKRPRAAEPYAFDVLHTPLKQELRADVHRCMCDVYAGDFATNGFGEDQLCRMAEPGAVYALARLDAEVVACAMVAYDGEVGLLGGVCTRPEHRRRGLSRTLVGRLLSDLQGVPRWLVLGTGSPSAAKIYAAHGFRGLNGGLGRPSKGYNPEDKGEWLMLRDSASPGPWEPASGVESEPFDLGALCLLRRECAAGARTCASVAFFATAPVRHLQLQAVRVLRPPPASCCATVRQLQVLLSVRANVLHSLFAAYSRR
mmetsp:Transcript_64572/g.188908  ORF Transcript_64572/g.188908 Transcript_64572/m.188908 type:complete len:267 (+) Transcript_64572:76-876(+)